VDSINFRGDNLKAKEADRNGIRCIRIDCPGCKESHIVTIETPEHWGWGFNGDFEKPTLSPSIMVRSSRSKEGQIYMEEFTKCHSFVTDGRIQFLSDSAHSLAGQTVDLPEIESATY
jgi:Family of unknown function (DUF6527)